MLHFGYIRYPTGSLWLGLYRIHWTGRLEYEIAGDWTKYGLAINIYKYI